MSTQLEMSTFMSMLQKLVTLMTIPQKMLTLATPQQLLALLSIPQYMLNFTDFHCCCYQWLKPAAPNCKIIQNHCLKNYLEKVLQKAVIHLLKNLYLNLESSDEKSYSISAGQFECHIIAYLFSVFFSSLGEVEVDDLQICIFS